MSDQEIIARQAAEIYDLKDKLAEKTEVANHWFNECKKRIPTCPLTFEETFSILSHAEFQRKMERNS